MTFTANDDEEFDEEKRLLILATYGLDDSANLRAMLNQITDDIEKLVEDMQRRRAA